MKGFVTSLLLVTVVAVIGTRAQDVILSHETLFSTHTRTIMDGVSWNGFSSDTDGNLARIDLYMGSYQPCKPVTGTLSVFLGTPANGQLLHSQSVTTSCDSCSTTKNTCLFSPACVKTACVRWHQIWLTDGNGQKTSIPLQASTTYSFKLEGFADGVIGVAEAKAGALAGGLPMNPHLQPSYSSHIFRTYLADSSAAAAAGFQAENSGVDANNPVAGDKTNADSASSAPVGRIVGTVLAIIVLLVAVAVAVRHVRRAEQTAKISTTEQTSVTGRPVVPLAWQSCDTEPGIREANSSESNDVIGLSPWSAGQQPTSPPSELEETEFQDPWAVPV
eukprot:m.53233 g.53233  ORF g.53233 m.53233 type:complete len:333 (-) comp18371_c0_seq1:74-1072(-)